ncbi:beta-lactamase family protein [Halomonas sp. LR3S48]|uniref:serine hydrolase domain-containing protein n=1 Tax=Halomonas sp. LR3S48 TaxID=2982694 RepID=UPI0021E4F154|nr:serine hydrolase [Halomonas sp. LR3S48]UYG05641.1 beta-lactamase family protein [Halomonas sp. LR3S48]
MSTILAAMARVLHHRWLPAMLPLLLCLFLLSSPSQRAQAQQGAQAGVSEQALAQLASEAEDISRLHAIVVAERGEIVLEHRLDGPATDQPVNIKSLSKTVLAALVGAAIEANLIEGVDQPIVALLGPRVPEQADPRIDEITVEHLLTLQAGLERTSGNNYGAWVASDDWVADALSRPFVARPGGEMLYSTGSSHLLSAALTEASGESTLALARRLLGEPLDIVIPSWPQDPQGIYFGGNDMALSPRALIQIGELYRHDGVVNGVRVLPEGWVEASWQAHGTSRWTGDGYGYGWFVTTLANERVYYGRGFGGQGLYVIPSRSLTIAITADPTPSSDGNRFNQEQLHSLVEGLLAGA